ncbi:bifunctional 2-polyprenyl-6-hydroxyphenol methylase/3-demethylubiquinol 3-O-methyltransferase UbiG [uncultured Acetatifactor sp.]|jgi:tellurite methyltransferase|uniref:class I SAM-dependent methyltransferase n=1 Tax=uncultured Acetatifactor sp. TaxID=1671927 RepID=UPI0025FE859A|nr:class I SAM-dependent methyltransferase [uncultured Acetatifactor sp.]MCI9230435.1 class I SAM-dependent methyltransferase [Lachnospiraceae bacterium]MCI9572416.1 class I SAM-dependent methyltransferase [Lachnospiraceae bacterium]MCI9650488.1 class I SAM-dependent methyltransferase [Lachnospiraceae bacterium]
MQSTPFWEQTYADSTVSTFSQGPTADVKEFCHIFPPNSAILDVGCGEGRNAIFLAGLGHTVDAFDISAAGIEKAREIARLSGVKVNFFRCDIIARRGMKAFDRDCLRDYNHFIR